MQLIYRLNAQRQFKPHFLCIACSALPVSNLALVVFEPTAVLLLINESISKQNSCGINPFAAKGDTFLPFSLNLFGTGI
jgi:hypothetical protein